MMQQWSFIRQHHFESTEESWLLIEAEDRGATAGESAMTHDDGLASAF